jgi:hypothetical protein
MSQGAAGTLPEYDALMVKDLGARGERASLSSVADGFAVKFAEHSWLVSPPCG